jgi:iron-sulfur cluster assembly accessory protein
MKIDESVHKYLNENKMLPDMDHKLYVGVKGGGCSGMQYVFQVVKFDSNKHLEYDPWVCSDNKSSLFLKNCTLKYKQSVGASILVVENPAAVSTCGCGESFSL